MQFLDDPELLGDATGRIRGGHSASWSWNEAINARTRDLRATGNELLANRAIDLVDVGQRVLRLLGGVSDSGPSLPDTPVILVAEDLTPSDTASLDPQRILGFCTASGGPTSHTAIIARSLDIPSICGAGPAVLKIENGRPAILDGFAGTLYLDPSAADTSSAREAQEDLAAQREAERLACYEPAITLDGHRVEVAANVSGAAEAAKAVEAGGEGIGLFRTEFLYLERDSAPTEDEQYAAYHEVAVALNGLPAIIRTLDIGGDKNVPYLNLPHEDNAFLGLRGIRLCLARPDLFRKQLRAVFRASSAGPLRLMYPMIATVEDVRAAKRITEEVRKELDAPPIEIGIMVEVPSTAVIAPELAREVDFFSVGTNDLTQYALAMDRLHPVLSRQADGLHPAVLRLIDMTVRAAEAEGKWVGVCGGIAGERRGALILTGMGVKELSVAIPSIAAIKAAIRKVAMHDLKELAQQALACATAAQVRALPLP
jgi:phosphocarrier protein FPr